MTDSTIKELEKRLADLKQEFLAYKSEVQDAVQLLDRRVTLLEHRLVGSPKR
jgi:hypothetical protein